MKGKGTPSRREDGQILAIFAGALVLLILISGLVIDGGNVFVTRRDSQDSADIGSMAGTKRLADYYVKSQTFTSTNNVYTAIATRMDQNNCSSAAGSICSWTARYVGPRTGSSFQDLGPVSSTDTAPPGAASGQKALGVKVNVTKTPQTYLLGVIGQSTWTVNSTATSMTGQPTGAPAGQLLPIAMVAPTTMGEGSIYALTSGSNGPGNFGWISWDGSNDAGSLATSLCTPDNPPFVLPFEFPGDPGKTNASSVRACLQQWVDNQQTVLIPIVEVHDRRPEQRQSVRHRRQRATASAIASSPSPRSSSPATRSRRSTRSTAGSSGPSRIPSTATRACPAGSPAAAAWQQASTTWASRSRPSSQRTAARPSGSSRGHG